MVTSDIKSAVWSFCGRPCLVNGVSTKTIWVAKGIRRTVEQCHVRFLDGQQPALGIFTRGAFTAKSRRVTGSQERVLRRTDDLVDQGMNFSRARQQALTEVAQGVHI